MSVRTAVVLAAGEGTRLRPLTRNRPKPMLPAANRPILEHVLDALVNAGMEELVLVIGYRRKRVQEHFGPEYRNVPITYVKQHKQLGSGHALLQARNAVSGPVLVVNGDHLIQSDAVKDVASAFESEGSATAIAVIKRSDASKYGAVTLAGGDVEEIIEKPDSNEYRLINAGIYAFTETIFDAIDETPRTEGELALTETIEQIIADERVRGVEIEGIWVDATYPWDLLQVATEVLEHGRVPEPAQDEGIWIHDDARIHENASLQPPVVVSADCEIGPGAVIGPNVAVGRNVTIDANAVVGRSVLDTDTRVGHNATVLDAVLGQDVTLGAQTTISGGLSDVRVDQQIFENQRLGGVLADRVEAGGAVTVEPGTLIGPGVTIGTGATVSKNIPEDATVMR